VNPEPLAASQPETNWLSVDELRSWRAYMAGNQRLMDQMNKDLQAKNDMTLAEYRILIMLSEAPGNSLRMSDLADGVLSSRSRLTHQIRRMEEQGMVRRSTCVDDGRGVLAHLTDEGRRRHEEAAPTHVDGVRRNFVDLLTPEQLSIVGAVFAKVDEVIAEREPG
jgi:DNA-binding MarR family transcriptional regulator